ncbi:DUF6519 domain-containing protein [Streptomyces sp. NPDC046821]|uniref:DUF6519 domain-containing protein n=1 Tax=Streptomyces sp. NPDC046821 TaxID=3154702 RepID=UPI0033FC88F1
MHADISRATFRPARHYSAVITQQGRVQLDADANEQAAIQLHQARATAVDLIGQHGGPLGTSGDTGFRIAYHGATPELDTLDIHGGHYYVDGILCDATRPGPGDAVPDDATAASDDDAESEDGKPAAPPAFWNYWDQPDAYRDKEKPADRLPTDYPFVVYLSVFERAVTAAEDPELREVALGSAMPDTAARRKVVWQVLPLAYAKLGIEGDVPPPDDVRRAFERWAAKEAAPKSRLAARSERPDHADEDPCLVKPDARYRGPENQLYRVEIHEGGEAGKNGRATFKWSRENGSVVFPVDEVDGTWVELATLGQDDKLDLNVGDHVELVDTAYASRLEPLPLLRVEELDLPGRRVRLSGEPDQHVGRRPELHPYLRRWDHEAGSRQRGRTTPLRGGAVQIEEGAWLPLEDGVEVYFEKGGTYRTGDYWTIAARTATGSVEWPVNAARKPLLIHPAGIVRHYAPLALVEGEGAPVDLRLGFSPLATRAVPPADAAALAAEQQAYDEELATEGAAPSNSRSETTAAAEAAVDDSAAGEETA